MHKNFLVSEKKKFWADLPDILTFQNDAEKVMEMLKESAESKKSVTRELRFTKKTGEIFTAQFTLCPEMSSAGEIQGFVEVLTDISEQKKAEMELEKSYRLNSLGVLAGGIAHDFNNILTGLFGYITIAKEQISPDHKAFKYLKKTELSLKRATRLTNKLLTFSKGGEPVKEVLNLRTFLSEEIAFDLSGSNVKVVFDCPEDVWNIEADKGQIQQLFSNLVVNARQAMLDGGHLYISLENVYLGAEVNLNLKPARYVRILFQDEGTGMEPETLNHLFEPYYTTKENGHGLGLATVYSIVNRHDGHIGVASSPGIGTTFTIHLPASEARQVEQDVPQLSLEELNSEKTNKVLILDDDEVIRSVLKEILENMGCRVETASNGKQAMEKYQHSMGR